MNRTKRISKNDIVKIISAENGQPREHVFKLIEHLILLIGRDVFEKSFTIRNFGTFKAFLSKRKTKKGHPNLLIKFKASKKFKAEFLNKNQTSGLDLLKKKIIPVQTILNKKAVKSRNAIKPNSDNLSQPSSGLNITNRIDAITSIDEYSYPIGEIRYRSRAFEILMRSSHVYPIINLPKPKTIAWNRVDAFNGIQGVCDSFLFEHLSHYFDNVQLTSALRPVGENWKLEPDISLFFQNENLLIDIEIDEPYDALTRKPLHYIGSFDRKRDRIFNDRGWCVIRFTEKQVFLYPLSCCKKIAEVVDFLINTSYSESLQNTPDLCRMESWSYDDALLLESECHRESYLNINFDDQILFKTDQSLGDFNSFPDSLIDKNDELKIKMIEDAIQNRYCLVFRYGDGDYESMIYPKGRKDPEGKYEFYGNNALNNYSCIYQLDLVTNLQVFPTHISKKVTYLDKVELNRLLSEAFINKHLVNIKYNTGSNGDIKWRVITGLTFHFYHNFVGLFYHKTYREYLHNRHMRNISYYDGYIAGHCSLRNETRTFKVDRIIELELLNSKYCNQEYLELIPLAYNSKAWEKLLTLDFIEAEEFSRTSLFYDSNSLFAKSNLAHALLFQGKYEQAMKIYKSHLGELVKDHVFWENAIYMDFLEFKKLSIGTIDFEELLIELRVTK